MRFANVLRLLCHLRFRIGALKVFKLEVRAEGSGSALQGCLDYVTVFKFYRPQLIQPETSIYRSFLRPTFLKTNILYRLGRLEFKLTYPEAVSRPVYEEPEFSASMSVMSRTKKMCHKGKYFNFHLSPTVRKFRFSGTAESFIFKKNWSFLIVRPIPSSWNFGLKIAIKA